MSVTLTSAKAPAPVFMGRRQHTPPSTQLSSVAKQQQRRCPRATGRELQPMRRWMGLRQEGGRPASPSLSSALPGSGLPLRTDHFLPPPTPSARGLLNRAFTPNAFPVFLTGSTQSFFQRIHPHRAHHCQKEGMETEQLLQRGQTAAGTVAAPAGKGSADPAQNSVRSHICSKNLTRRGALPSCWPGQRGADSERRGDLRPGAYPCLGNLAWLSCYTLGV